MSAVLYLVMGLLNICNNLLSELSFHILGPYFDWVRFCLCIYWYEGVLFVFRGISLLPSSLLSSCLGTIIIEPNCVEEQIWVNKGNTLRLDILRYRVKCYNIVGSREETKMNKLIKAEERQKLLYIYIPPTHTCIYIYIHTHICLHKHIYFFNFNFFPLRNHNRERTVQHWDVNQ